MWFGPWVCAPAPTRFSPGARPAAVRSGLVRSGSVRLRVWQSGLVRFAVRCGARWFGFPGTSPALLGGAFAGALVRLSAFRRFLLPGGCSGLRPALLRPWSGSPLVGVSAVKLIVRPLGQIEEPPFTGALSFYAVCRLVGVKPLSFFCGSAKKQFPYKIVLRRENKLFLLILRLPLDKSRTVCYIVNVVSFSKCVVGAVGSPQQFRRDSRCGLARGFAPRPATRFSPGARPAAVRSGLVRSGWVWFGLVRLRVWQSGLVRFAVRCGARWFRFPGPSSALLGGAVAGPWFGGPPFGGSCSRVGVPASVRRYCALGPAAP